MSPISLRMYAPRVGPMPVMVVIGVSRASMISAILRSISLTCCFKKSSCLAQSWIIVLNVLTIGLSLLILLLPSMIITKINPARVMHFE